jgi:hypothetical protein
MEENEQLSENPTEEQFEDGENVAETANEQVSASVEKHSDDSTSTVADSVITDSQATIKIEGQEFPLEAALAQDDKLLKTILQPHFASIENANITREVKNGKLTVCIVKKAQHKGS